MGEVVKYLLSKGELGLLVIAGAVITWALWKKLTASDVVIANMTKIIEANTASNVAVSTSLDTMADRVTSQNAQNAEFHRSVLQVFANSIGKK